MKYIYTIIDKTIERTDFATEDEYLKEAQLFVGDEADCRDKCCELLNEYFDLYGDVIELLLVYIPTDNLISLMDDLEYEIKKYETKKEERD